MLQSQSNSERHYAKCSRHAVGPEGEGHPKYKASDLTHDPPAGSFCRRFFAHPNSVPSAIPQATIAVTIRTVESLKRSQRGGVSMTRILNRRQVAMLHACVGMPKLRRQAHSGVPPWACHPTVQLPYPTGVLRAYEPSTSSRTVRRANSAIARLTRASLSWASISTKNR